MVRYFFVLFLPLLFLGCGGSDKKEEQVSIEQEQYLSVARAPTSTGVSIFQNIQLTFSAELNSSTITNDAMYLVDNTDTPIGSKVMVDEKDSSLITLIPNKYFKPSSTYHIIITTAIADVRGRHLSKEYRHTFITEDEIVETSPLALKGSKPNDGATQIDVGSDIYLEFDRFISPDNLLDSTLIELKNNSNGSLVPGRMEVFNATFSFIPDQDLNESTSYTLQLTQNLSDMYGNIYDISTQQANWSFTTGTSVDLYTREGFNNMTSLNLDKSSYLIRTLRDDDNSSVILVSTIDGIEVYKITYPSPMQRPAITHLYTHTMQSKVNDITVFLSKYIAVSTMNNGVYTFSVDESRLTQISHVDDSEAIFGVYAGIDGGGTLDRLYAVGPFYGLKVFNMDSTGVLSLTNAIDINGTPIDVIDMVNPQDLQRRVYIADYDGYMHIYDNNFTLEKSIELNTSVRNVAQLKDSYGGVTGIGALSAIGEGYGFNFVGDLQPSDDLTLPFGASDMTSISDGMSSFELFSDKARGVLVLKEESSFKINSLIPVEHGVISATPLHGFKNHTPNGYYLFAAMTPRGDLQIYNLEPDISQPSFIDSEPQAGGTIDTDDNVSFVLYDSNLDYVTLSTANISLVDQNTSQSIDFNLHVNIPDLGYFECILEPTTQLQAHDYKIIVSQNVQDIVGNRLSTPIEISFSAVAPPNLVADTASGPEDALGGQLANGNVLDNDIYAFPMQVFNYEIDNNGTIYVAGTSTSIPNYGSITMEVNGTYSFYPVAEFYGDVPTIRYVTNFGDSSTLDIEITNDNLDAVNDSVSVDMPVFPQPQNSETGNLFANDESEISSIISATISIDGGTSDPMTINSVGVTTPISYGVGEGEADVTLYEDGSYEVKAYDDYGYGYNIEVIYVTNTGGTDGIFSIEIISQGGQLP